MELLLVRDVFTDNSTTGTLYVNGTFECYTLEDKIRDKKIAGITAIPAGTYKVDITWSPKYQRRMPLLLDVPNYTGVRIHSGNTHKDTEGCILVGKTRDADWISNSRRAYTALFEKIEDAINSQEDVTLRIVDSHPSSHEHTQSAE